MMLQEAPTLMETPNSPPFQGRHGCHPSQWDCSGDSKDTLGGGRCRAAKIDPSTPSCPSAARAALQSWDETCCCSLHGQSPLGAAATGTACWEPRPSSAPQCPAPQLLVLPLPCQHPLSGAPPSALLPDQVCRGAAGGLLCSPLLPPAVPRCQPTGTAIVPRC